MRNIFLVLLTLFSCGRTPQETTTYSPSPSLLSRRNHYLELTSTQQDHAGFVEADRCDSLLWSTLLSAAGGTVNVRAARNEDTGQWFRRPLSYPECLASGEARSTISRDMLLGVMWYGWARKDLELIENLRKYAEEHNLVMGQGDGSIDGFGRTILSPQLYSLLSALESKLSVGLDGVVFEDHLRALRLGLLDRVAGLTDGERAELAALADQAPRNALFQALAGRKAEAERLLLEQFPSDRLPTSADWCESYRYQRDQDTLEPCPAEGRTHPGVDFLFTSAVLTGM